MDKKELKELKKAYKSAVLAERADAMELEAKLKPELVDDWDDFCAEVDAFVDAVKKLAQTVYEKASDLHGNMLVYDLGPYLAEAKNLGAGAQPYVQRAFDRGKAERDAAVLAARKKERLERSAAVRKDAGQKVPEVRVKPAPVSGRTEDRKTEKHRNHVLSVKARKAHTVSIAAVKPCSSVVPELPAQVLSGNSPDALRALTSHPNDITTLLPSSAWTACVDESYLGREEDFMEGGCGIIAGVVFDDTNPLPEVGQLHCAEDYTEEKLCAADKVVETILGHRNCGVLALPARAQELSKGWADLLSAWTDVLVRLLPFPDDDSPVSVTLRVEPRGIYQRVSDFAALDLICMKSLKEAFPERARRLKLSFLPMPKAADEGTSYNSYPDVVGHTCLAKDFDPTARQRYQASGWDGTCYLNARPAAISRVLKYFNRRSPLDAESWSVLMSQSSTGLGRGLAGYFGRRAKSDPAEWQAYLGFLDAHLKSGSINMRLLRQEVGWLEEHYPASGVSGKSRLVWLIGKLALANHEGKLLKGREDPLRREFDGLCARLYDEAAPLVCDAVLNLAVAYTNAFEFEMALGTIQGLLGKDMALVGRSAYGKLLSTEGQHFAFLGMGDDAVDRFRKAIDCFNGLSDERERTVNVGITSAYLATTVMDHRPDEALRIMAFYLLGDENAAEADLAARTQVLATTRAEKFAHHVLLRYAANAERDDVIRKTYRSLRGKWSEPAAGHPWELIEFYRAMLTAPSPERMKHLENAYRLALQEGGETVMVIAAVIAGAALVDSSDVKWRRRFDEALEVAATITGLRENGRYQALVDQPTAKLSGLELAAKVLPFNFR